MHSARFAALVLLGLSVGAEGLTLRTGSGKGKAHVKKEGTPNVLFNMALTKSSNPHSRALPLALRVKENPMKGQNGQHIVQWAQEHIMTEGRMDDAGLWPELPTEGHLDLGLTDPQVYVVSMKESTMRRKHFIQRFAKLGLKLSPGSARWAMGINASEIPMMLRNPKGEEKEGAEEWWNVGDNIGAVGCLMAHTMIFHDHAKNHPFSDLIVLEDDVDFRPDFKKHWDKFYNSLPNELPISQDSDKTAPIGMMHIGGDALWSKPIKETATYFQVNWASRTWGYVIKAHAVQLIKKMLMEQDQAWNMASDQLLTTGRDSQGLPAYPVVVPKYPLVYSAACGGSSMTAATPDGRSDNEWIRECGAGVTGFQTNWQQACWSHTWMEHARESCAPGSSHPNALMKPIA